MTENQTEAALLPCPFCGGQAQIKSGRASEDAMFARVECGACLGSTDYFEDAYTPREQAIAAWNTRTHATEKAACEARVAWQPIETAPRDGDNILIIAATAYSPQARVGWWDGTWFAFYSRPSKPSGGGVTHMLEATHWMPLPEAPATLKETRP